MESHLQIVYILIPTYNRRNTTLTCLERLYHGDNLSWNRVVVIDDGSTDGTETATRTEFPTVEILSGDGNLWWAGAIHKGMEYAYNQGADYLIWLNDDTLPSPDTISLMVSTCAAEPKRIVTAQCYEDVSLTKPTYGGRKVKGFSLKFLAASQDEVLECDVCSGNLVCFPRSVIDQIGYPPSKQTPQTWADVIYTWQAKQAGYKILVLGSATAICPTNTLEEGWATSPIPMLQRWKMLGSPKSSIYPPAYWFYCQSIYGRLGVVPFAQVYLKLVLFTALRMVIPLSWVQTLKKINDSKGTNTKDSGNTER